MNATKTRNVYVVVLAKPGKCDRYWSHGSWELDPAKAIGYDSREDAERVAREQVGDSGWRVDRHTAAK